MKKTVVITGSTRGIGFGLAESFLMEGWNVVVSGSSLDSTQEAAARLDARYPAERILPAACDVQEFQQVESLWDRTIHQFSQIDIWINNAGTSGPRGDLWALTPEASQAVVQTNFLGTIYGSQVAIRGMLAQGFGALYNMEGYGSDGTVRKGMASIYGSTKAGIHFLTKSLAKDLQDRDLIIGSLRPGMVITDFVMQHFEDRPDDLERVRGIFNLIADRPENVSPWLVKKMLTNEKSGVILDYSTTWRLLGRFLAAPFKKRNVFVDYDFGKTATEITE